MPCRRCGDCCRKYPCGLSWLLFNPDAEDDLEAPPHECPALEFDEGKATCGLVDHPLAYVTGDSLLSYLIYEHLAIGEGCGAQSPSGKRLIHNLVSRLKED